MCGGRAPRGVRSTSLLNHSVVVFQYHQKTKSTHSDASREECAGKAPAFLWYEVERGVLYSHDVITTGNIKISVEVSLWYWKKKTKNPGDKVVPPNRHGEEQEFPIWKWSLFLQQEVKHIYSSSWSIFMLIFFGFKYFIHIYFYITMIFRKYGCILLIFGYLTTVRKK